MKKIWLLVAALTALAFFVACNKQTPPRLDYTEKDKKGDYSYHGLPGEAFIGGTPAEDKYHGYHTHGDDHAKPADDKKKPDEKKPEDKKPDEKKPEDKKPEDEKPDEKKPEEKTK